MSNPLIVTTGAGYATVTWRSGGMLVAAPVGAAARPVDPGAVPAGGGLLAGAAHAAASTSSPRQQTSGLLLPGGVSCPMDRMSSRPPQNRKTRLATPRQGPAGAPRGARGHPPGRAPGS